MPLDSLTLYAANPLAASRSRRRSGARATQAPLDSVGGRAPDVARDRAVESRTPTRVVSPLTTALAAALILIAGLAAYSNSFAGVFVFDDEPAIAHNRNLRSLWPLTTAMSAPPDTTLSGRPSPTYNQPNSWQGARSIRVMAKLMF